MKKFIRQFLLNTITIAIIAYLLPGVSYNQDVKILLITALALTLLNLLIRPLIKLLLLPLNLLTLGLFGWLANVIILYLLTLLVPQFTISAFTLGPVAFSSYTIPAITLSRFWAIIFVSFILNIIVTLLGGIL